MKKLFRLAVAILLSVSLVACGGNEKKQPSNADNQQQPVAANPTPEPTSIPTPTSKPEKKELTYGDTFTFDGFELTIYDTIEWTSIVNKYSDYNGKEVVLIPVHIKNLSGETGTINMFYINLFGSAGTELDSVSTYFDNILGYSGDLRDGAEADVYLAVLYDGDGDYYVEFDSFGEKVEVKLPILK